MKTIPITYRGPYSAVEIAVNADHRIDARRGTPVEVPENVAEELLQRPDWVTTVSQVVPKSGTETLPSAL